MSVVQLVSRLVSLWADQSYGWSVNQSPSPLVFFFMGWSVNLSNNLSVGWPVLYQSAGQQGIGQSVKW